MAKWRMSGLLFLLLALAGCSNTEWEESSLFESGGYTMIGEPNNIGFIYDDSDVLRFSPNKVKKYMWHVWGEDILGGTLKVIATHEQTKDEMVVLDTSLGGANNGADAHIPSTMSLPESGMWKLEAHVNDRLRGSIFVKVHEEPS